MNKLLRIISISGVVLFSVLSAPTVMAAEAQIGVVNVTQLFNDSDYVKKANKTLQTNAKGMEDKVQGEQKKLQDLASEYDKAKPGSSAKTSLQNQFAAQQKKLNQMTQDFQQKIRDEQNTGMQQFNAMVRVAVEKVAKQKHLNAVLASTAIAYTDNTWVDITKDVQDAM